MEAGWVNRVGTPRVLCSRTLAWVCLVVVAGAASAAGAAAPDSADSDGPWHRSDYLIFPELALESEPEDPLLRRAARGTANASYGFLNDTLSDTWNVAKSPLDWRWKGWLTAAGVVGVATGFVFLVDEKVSDAAVESQKFRDFGGDIEFLSSFATFGAVTGAFALSGLVLQRPVDRRTAKLLLEATAVTFGYSTGFKHLIGRRRPGGPDGARDFEPFSGQFSMPSGEATTAYAMAGVVTSQYPNWPTRIVAYGLATLVGVGRISRDDHFTSDILVSAALGIFVSKSVVHFNRLREAERAARRKSGASPARPAPFRRHFVQVSTRGFRWTMLF